MKVRIIEEVDTTSGKLKPGEVFLPREEALKLIREKKAEAVASAGQFVARGFKGSDRIIKSIIHR